jgi:hypothetical protein
MMMMMTMMMMMMMMMIVVVVVVAVVVLMMLLMGARELPPVQMGSLKHVVEERSLGLVLWQILHWS